MRNKLLYLGNNNRNTITITNFFYHMVTNLDFNNIIISDFTNDFARVFKQSDVKKADDLGLRTVGDVLADTRKGACKSMKAKLRTYPDALVGIHNYLNDSYKLPARVTESFTTAELLKQLFKELDELVDRVKAMPFEQNMDGIISRIEDVLKVVKYRYIHNLSDFEIAAELNITSETCRTHHNKFISAIKSGIANTNVVGKLPFTLIFGLSQTIKERFQAILSMYKSGISKDVLADEIGSREEGIIQFFLDMLDASIYSTRNGTFVGEYVVSGITLTRFDADCSILFDMISKEHEHVLGPKIKAYLAKHIKSSGNLKAETLMRMIDSSGQFDIVEKDGVKCYRLKYEFLKNDVARNERILFENRGKYLSRQQMEDEYNRRARLFGMSEKKGDDYFIGATDKITSQNSVWHWIEDGDTGTLDPRPLIRKYVQGKGGAATFGEIRDYLVKNNLFLKDKTVRTYLAAFCKHFRKTDTYTVKTGKTCAGRGDIANEMIVYLRSEAGPVHVSEIAKALGTSHGRICRNIDNHKDVFKTVKKGQCVYVSIQPTFTQSIVKSVKTGSRKEPLHRTYMRNMAIDILKKANGGPLPLKDVADRISSVIANTSFSDTVVYKVFEHDIFKKAVAVGKKSARTVSLNIDVYRQLFEKDADFAEKKVAESSPSKDVPAPYDWNNDYEDLKDAVIAFTKKDPYCQRFDVAKSFDTMNDIMKGNKVSLNPDSYFWLIQELLYKYLTQKTTKIEREFLRDNLAYKYEPFLTNYYYTVRGREIGVEGLATILNVLQKDGLLPARYSDWSSSYTSSLVKKRNRVHASHRDLDSTIKTDILQFLVLYLYTSSLTSI